jgi:hypothetical protein
MSIEFRRVVFNHIHRVLPERPTIMAYRDDTEEYAVDIYRYPNEVAPGVTTLGTIGLAEATIDKELPNDDELRVEFIGACDQDWADVYALALSSCAFNIMIHGYSCEPGAVYPDVLSQYDSELNMKHMLFQPLFMWEIPNLDLDGMVVTWLSPIPISIRNSVSVLTTAQMH